MIEEPGALAEGFYWIAEKQMWGYENIIPDHKEALRYYRRAADLGFSDANIRVGQLYEYGKGTSQNPKEVLSNYRKALAASNWLALPCIALLLSRTAHSAKAEILWDRFFRLLSDCPKPKFVQKRQAN
jgi:TPR repeat protein